MSEPMSDPTRNAVIITKRKKPDGSEETEYTVKPSKKGALTGAAAGFAVGGPVGAAAGAIFGFIFGPAD